MQNLAPGGDPLDHLRRMTKHRGPGRCATRFCIGLVLLSLAWLTDSAAAHGILMESKPQAGETVPLRVPQIGLRFDTRIERSLSWLRLAGPSEDLVPLSTERAEKPRPEYLTATAPSLPPGQYTVHWRILTTDGHLSHGRFSFQVAGRE